MKTIWDPAKRTSNLAKHGVDFLDVDDAFWSDPMALTLEDSDTTNSDSFRSRLMALVPS
jgi:uncharacterized DUF497 family protein